jgi:hypothetical protein
MWLKHRKARLKCGNAKPKHGKAVKVHWSAQHLCKKLLKSLESLNYLPSGALVTLVPIRYCAGNLLLCLAITCFSWSTLVPQSHDQVCSYFGPVSPGVVSNCLSCLCQMFWVSRLESRCLPAGHSKRTRNFMDQWHVGHINVHAVDCWEWSARFCHYQCPQRLEYPSLENQIGQAWAAFHEGLAQSQ